MKCQTKPIGEIGDQQDEKKEEKKIYAKKNGRKWRRNKVKTIQMVADRGSVRVRRKGERKKEDEGEMYGKRSKKGIKIRERG